MKKYYRRLKLIFLCLFTALVFIFLTLQYQKINAGYHDTQEINTLKNDNACRFSYF